MDELAQHPVTKTFFQQVLPGQLGLSLFQVLPDVIFWVKDRQGKFVYINEGFLRECTLHKREEVIGKSDFDLFPTSLAAIFRHDDMELMNSKIEIWDKKELVSTAAGDVEWRATTKVPLLNFYGHVCGTAGVSRKLGHKEGCSESAQSREMKAIVEAIYQCLDQEIKVSEIAQAAKMSVSTLERNFKSQMGTTPKKFILQAKISKACEHLVSSNLPVKSIGEELGFSDNASFARSFKRLMGFSPSAYRRQFS